ncbi:hypothetical protein CMT37_18495 [Elizabethkingia anophelis]|nr:hypothetical protein [Elizabethkingia anophelis]
MGKDLLFRIIILLLLISGLGLKAQHRSQEIPEYNYGISYRPSLQIKHNILQDIALAVNLSLEYSLTQKLSIEIPIAYNGWDLAKDKKMRQFLVQPELRYWIDETFNGHFFGVHPHVGIFNMAGLPFAELKEYRTQGNIYGIGLSWGYQYWLGKRWAMETTVGIGYAHMDYTRYINHSDGAKYGQKYNNGTYNYIGPTKAGLSIIYILK